MISRNIFSMRVNFSIFHTVSWQHWLRLSLIFTAIRTFKYFFILTYSRSMYAFLWNTSGKIVGTSIKPYLAILVWKIILSTCKKRMIYNSKGHWGKPSFTLNRQTLKWWIFELWTSKCLVISFINSSTFLLFIH